MDLRNYYRKIREVEQTLVEQYPLVTSTETPDGGKPGRISEVSKELAARLIVEGKAVLATEEEKLQFVALQAEAKLRAEKAELARRVQVAIISDSDLQSVQQSKRK